MQAEFWHQKWQSNDIAFHEGEANALLVAHIDALALPTGGRVFVPLCGKTRDIAWLLTQGYRVAGAELSPIAIGQLFAELGVQPEISTNDSLTHYRAPDIDVFVGDMFALSRAQLGPVDASYDRAALVALPEALRHRYTQHLMQITANAPQLLICYEYDQRLQAGPPFAISDKEVHQHYAGSYKLSLLASTDLPGGLKGRCPAQEKTWLLATDGSEPVHNT